MAVFNREKPYKSAMGLVAPMEPFFYQDGFMFNTDGDEVTVDGDGIFVLAVQEAEEAPKKAVKTVKPVAEPPVEATETAADLPDLDNI